MRVDLSLNSKVVETLRPLGKAAVALHLFPADDSPLPRLESKFGGLPYMKKDEEWPICPSCENLLTFICQADLAAAGYHLPSKARFFTFFYCADCMPQGEPDEPQGQWQARLYSNDCFHESLLAEVEPYFGPYPLTECRIEFRPAVSFPDREFLNVIARDLDVFINELSGDDWDAYQRLTEKLGGICEDQSYIGGYPTWDQDHVSFAPLEFFATIASESEANLLFGDNGHVNLFVPTDGSSVPLMISQCA